MEQVNPTRMELLTKRAQIALAEQGRELLKEKRNALWQELMQTADVVLRESGEVETAASAARRALAESEALDGREVAQSAAFASQREISIEVTSVNVMGVRVPRIERAAHGTSASLARSIVPRGYSLASTSRRVDAAAEKYKEELELIIELAASEMRLRRLAEEIRKTTTRVNALEHIVLPRLEAQRAAIERALEERERQDRFRLKRVQAALARKRAANL